ncbi:hypothetical protein [Dysgonomonas sp. ZJ279]|uniref:hypothetical protein n=1 Tax=Dysgonomonas sp. ZJ279 TaxID=2709796 RepID=UPI0013EB2C37|nr:hypothetical protein [Dysgonomonas sp. ZJ279]
MRQLNSVLRLTLLLCLALSFTFCSSDDDNDNPIDNNVVVDTPGLISGLGDKEGELTGTPFVLPTGITLDGVITGSRSHYYKSLASKESKLSSQLVSDFITKASAEVDVVMGSGYYVSLYIPLKNTTAQDIEVTFPAGTIIVSNSGDYQNGVLLKKVSVKVPAGNKTLGFVLLMYCGNNSKSSSSSSETYKWGVVSNSSLIVDLCNRLADKKINYEEFEKGEEAYNDQCVELQSILWSLTDYGDALNTNQIQWIDALPKSAK